LLKTEHLKLKNKKVCHGYIHLPGKGLARFFLLFDVVDPCLAGLDENRQSLYPNLGALMFLAFAAVQVGKQILAEKKSPLAPTCGASV
jgi:hypothetical protein